MNSSLLPASIVSLPKAELHLHLEGSIQPATVCALTAQHNILLTEDEVRRRYTYRDFTGFIDAFKWVTSFLREPSDYGLIARDLCEHLLTQGVIYAEVTLSVGVMLLRKQKPEANFEAILQGYRPVRKARLARQLDFRCRTSVRRGGRHGSRRCRQTQPIQKDCGVRYWRRRNECRHGRVSARIRIRRRTMGYIF